MCAKGALLPSLLSIESSREEGYDLQRNGLDPPVFLLSRSPFLTEAEGVKRASRLLKVAAKCAAVVHLIISVRCGNPGITIPGAAQ